MSRQKLTTEFPDEESSLAVWLCPPFFKIGSTSCNGASLLLVTFDLL